MQAPEQMIEQGRNALDGTIGIGAVTAPVWAQWLENGLTYYMLAAGAILVTLRVLLAYREWKRKRED